MDILTQSLNPLYENLKKEIKQYEINEQLAFDESLKELRKDKESNIYSNFGPDNILVLYLNLITVEILWWLNISTMIRLP